MLTMVNNELIIHETPLEKINIDENSIEIMLDDQFLQRRRLFFKPFQAIRITTEDCCDRSLLYQMVDLGMRECYKRFIFEETESPWIAQLQESLVWPEDNFLLKSKHFILHAGHSLIEIVAWSIKID